MTDPGVLAPAAGPQPWLATLAPGYFAMTMATGIVATGAALEGVQWLADALLVIAGASYVVLIVLNLARLARHGRAFTADLTSHSKGFSFLTIVAATNVLGGAAVVVYDWTGVAWVMWWFSVGLWAVLLYSALIAAVICEPKPGLASGINGTWFLLTVSTESIATLGGLLIPHHRDDALAFVSVAMFLLGIVLYLIVMTMVFLRWTFWELDPTEADPPAWIAAGAVAITVLAGSNLLNATAASPRIERLAPAMETLVTLAWATSTFWFPLMAAIGVWRHVVRRTPLRYHASYWALVFPLGMYAVATYRMRTALGLGFGAWLPTATFVVALLAWLATFAGLAHLGVTTSTRSRTSDP